MFCPQTPHGFNDFYNSIQNTHEPNTGFGKNVKQKIKQSVLNNESAKFSSLESFSGSISTENDTKKSLSSNTLATNKSYAKLRKTSEVSNSSNNSMCSVTSATSVSTANTAQESNSPTENSKKKACKGKKKKTGEISYKKKFKTEICKFWANQGFCQFGETCAFAHGKVEVKEKMHVSSNYKTKRCVQFHENGICPYGTRCQFVHCFSKDCESLKDEEGTGYAFDVENAELWFTENQDCMCMKRTTRKRLPYFEMLSSEVHNVNNNENI